MITSVVRRAFAQDPDLARLWADVLQKNLAAIAERAKADPKAFKLSRVMPAGVEPRYRYFEGGKDGLGRSVRFCWSTVTNVAGFYLGWREVIGKTSSKRDRWVARRLRRRVKEIARERWDRYRAGHSASTGRP